MDQIQVNGDSSSIDYDNVDSEVRTSTANDTSISNNYHVFENFSNEIIYNIFEYLDAYYSYKAFFNLNTRFQNILMQTKCPIEFSTSNISKASYQDYYENFIQPNKHRISSMRLTNPFITQSIFSSVKNLLGFTRLQSLIIEKIDYIRLKNILEYLSLFSRLSLLIIDITPEVYETSMIYEPVLCFPTSKYSMLSSQMTIEMDRLYESINKFRFVEHLVIKNRVYIEQLAHILTYVPRLHRLSITILSGFVYASLRNIPIVLNYLTHLSIELENIRFDDFESLIVNHFPHLEVLRLSTSSDIEYLNAVRWENLILSYIPRLRIFDLQCQNISIENNPTLDCKMLMDRFRTSFWIKRKWYFQHQHNFLKIPNSVNIYSARPYRRKHFTLFCTQNSCSYPDQIEQNLAVVRTVHILMSSTMNSYSTYFPNANRVIISHIDAVMSSDPILLMLTSMVCWSKLKNVIIDCDKIYFSDFIEILNLVHDCETLILTSLLFTGEEHLWSRINEKFRLLSKKNNVTNLTIMSPCTLHQVDYLIDLFPRLKHLDIFVFAEDFQSVLKHLVRNDDKTRNLITIHIKSSKDVWIEKVTNTIEEVRKPSEISALAIGCFRCYLWR